MYSSSRRASEIASNAICLARDGLSAGDLSEISCRYGSAARAVSPGCNAHHPPPCFQRPWRSTSRVYAPFRSHAPRHADAPGASQSNASDSCVSSLDRGETTIGWFRASPLVQGIPLLQSIPGFATRGTAIRRATLSTGLRWTLRCAKRP